MSKTYLEKTTQFPVEEPGLQNHELTPSLLLPKPGEYALTSEIDRLLTPARVAEICETKVATVWGWCRSGRLNHIRLTPRSYRVRESALREFFRISTR